MPGGGSPRREAIEAGILTRGKHKPVRTMTLSTTLVKRPKNPFQSPSTHQAGPCASVVVAAVIKCSSGSGKRRQDRRGCRHPSENPALGLDHLDAGLRERFEIGGNASLEHE